MPFGDNLKQARRSCGLTQEEVAARFGVSVRTYSRWECGANDPSVDNIAALATLFGVTPNYLFGFSDEAPAD